jgi:hypothetical protein
MAKFDKYKSTRKVLKPGEQTGHLSDDQLKRVVENPRERGKTRQGYDWFWGLYGEAGSYGLAILKRSASGAASVARFITGYPEKKPPRG